ncbi:MAG: dockerin type I domain-containing protein [Ruminococcus sp.]|nr:dockerin type I domain-containing protein [Ruminococcus sp.]
MSSIIRHGGDSYRITKEPEPNKDGNIYVFNGITLDSLGSKELVKMLFVRKPLGADDLKAYGNVTRICRLPDSFSDERFHKKYSIDSSQNSSFVLYVPDERRQPENSAGGKRLLLIVLAAVAAVILLGAAAFAAVSFIGGRGDGGSPAEVSTGAERSAGDLNGDGSVDAKDASLVLANYIKLSAGRDVPEDEILLGDVNRDGKSDAVDASLILGYYSFRSANDSNMTFDEYCEEQP